MAFHHKPLTVPTVSEMETAILVDGGFTYDPLTGSFIRAGRDNGKSPTGYMIAVPDTASDDPEDLITAWETYPFPTYIGGWYNPETQRIDLELSELFPVDLATASRIGRHRNQKAILEMHTGNTIWLD